MITIKPATMTVVRKKCVPKIVVKVIEADGTYVVERQVRLMRS